MAKIKEIKLKETLSQENVEITKDMMQKYENVRISGVTNMFDVNRVMELTRLTREQLIEMMKHYDLYMKKFNIERG